MPTPTGIRTVAQPEVVLRTVGIRAGWRVVDFGCGAGYYLVPAARFVGSTGRVVGIDVRATAVDEAKRRVEHAGLAGQIDLFRADLTRPRASGLADAWADLVLLVGILYQSDPRALLAEASRIVKTIDGRIVIIEWDEIATPIGPPPEQRVPRDAVLGAAKSAGLTLLSAFSPSPYQYGLLFVKPSENAHA